MSAGNASRPAHGKVLSAVRAPAPENVSQVLLLGNSSLGAEDYLDVNTDVYSRVLVTVIYVALFAVGCLGNAITLHIVVRRKPLPHLQSTIHYHLASLAASDLLILVLCMPVELYNFIWVHHPWAFGEVVCRGYYFLRDGCSYATALNIASLSAERYLALCHPFKAKSIVSRGRTRKLLCALWLVSLLLASPMLLTMGLQTVGNETICTPISSVSTAKTVLQVNALLSFGIPVAVISLLNWLIGRQLQNLSQQAMLHDSNCAAGSSAAAETSRERSLRHSVAMLRVVVVAFVVCWLPYHTRRLMFCYITEWTDLYDFYHYFYMVTNVLFYVSSAINPILYNLVSANYRELFLFSLGYFCLPCCRRRGLERRATDHQQLQQLPSTVATPHTSRVVLCSSIVKEVVY
ncbi:neurotensin receptor type 1-like isoform X2 [Denticeps clupeoides]|uniref:neurotensin receptor type 1-like isoform X2 n=1 Tax=Denticeps clupeoides TaxID=299321 RepID=UPI0010A32E19|nr:neurotensin receptor type 1-like isoform X2 [Denticeps clupeoides]